MPTEPDSEQRNLLNETPEAAAFVKDAIENVERLKLFDGETFARLNKAILASAGVDSHGKIVSVEDLELFVSRADAEIVWSGAEHNPLIQPVGRILAMRVFTSPVAGVGFIAGVVGTYGGDYYLKFSDVGIDLSDLVSPTVQVGDVPDALVAAIAYSPQEVAPSVIAEMLADAPEFVDRHPLLQFRYAFVTPPHFTLMIEAGVMLMARKFIERSGEKLSDAAFELLSWLKKSVFKRISELKQDSAFVQFSTVHDGCRIALVIASKDPDVLTDAASTMGDAVAAAIAIVQKLKALRVATLTFEYDLPRKKWLPLHAASRKGRIIAERPHLIVIKEAQGLSIAGFHDIG